MSGAQRSLESLNQRAKACLAKKVDIPASPLWHMARTAKYDSASDLKYLQDALDYLTCKARSKLEFLQEDKVFLKELYEAFWWGGRYKGFPEAAQLADHYVNGGGKTLSINSEVYQKSKIVQATMIAMKKYVLELKAKGHNFVKMKCNNPAFMSRPYVQPLKKMNYRTEGKMKPSGVLEAAQDDHRLHKTDGHFYLEGSFVEVRNVGIRTVWHVDSIYDFEPFEKQNYYTEIPLGNAKLVLYDGLSEYMTQIGVAKVFHYRAEWAETWSTK